MRIIAVIPAYNEATHVVDVVRSNLDFVDQVVVVDDGSSDNTSTAARQAGARVYRHVVNRGLGGAIATGLRAALALDADIIVTLDSDGQHLPEDIVPVIAPILAGEADFVIGSRLINPRGMPLSRRAANRIAALCSNALFGVSVCDSQSG